MAAPVSTSYPLPLYNFLVTIGARTMSFTEVSGIAIAYEHITYRHGLSFWEGERIATVPFDAFAPVTMKRGTIRGSEPLFLHDWLRSKRLAPVDVSLCDPQGKPVLAWKIARAVPVKLSAPVFDPKTNDVSIDVLELQARGVTLGLVQA